MILDSDEEMMMRLIKASPIVLLFLLSACTPPQIVRQEIPVSSRPIGATVLVDGTPVGTTPTRISLERDKNYMLTLLKDGYEQADIPITRRYQADRVLMSAVQSGVQSALFFKDSGMGVQRGLSSISSQESTGEAYVLEPAAVTVELPPLGSSGASAMRSRRPTEGPTRPTAGSGTTAREGSILDASPQTVLAAGAVAAAASARPIEKKWTTSSSNKTRVRGDGSVVTRSSKTSVGVSVDPVGLIQVVDTLFTNGGIR